MKFLRDIKFVCIFFLLRWKGTEAQRELLMKRVCTHRKPFANCSARSRSSTTKGGVVATDDVCGICGDNARTTYKLTQEQQDLAIRAMARAGNRRGGA